MELSPRTILAFSAATVVLLLLPGPAVMYIVTRSAAQGRRAGLVSVAGIHLGTVAHVAAAMIGLSAVLAASAAAFTVVKLVGATYLIWLGAQSIRRHRAGLVPESGPLIDHRPLSRVFVDGAVLNVLNPKTALFFVSFVPQFVDPGAAHPVIDVAVLGGLFIAIGLITDGLYAMAGGWIGAKLRLSPRLQRRKYLLAGGTYLGLGALTAVSGNRST
jgi:threonine/homoserine/homoserine lactone efflux protein